MHTLYVNINNYLFTQCEVFRAILVKYYKPTPLHSYPHTHKYIRIVLYASTHADAYYHMCKYISHISCNLRTFSRSWEINVHLYYMCGYIGPRDLFIWNWVHITSRSLLMAVGGRWNTRLTVMKTLCNYSHWWCAHKLELSI